MQPNDDFIQSFFQPLHWRMCKNASHHNKTHILCPLPFCLMRGGVKAQGVKQAINFWAAFPQLLRELLWDDRGTKGCSANYHAKCHSLNLRHLCLLQLNELELLWLPRKGRGAVPSRVEALNQLNNPICLTSASSSEYIWVAAKRWQLNRLRRKVFPCWLLIRFPLLRPVVVGQFWTVCSMMPWVSPGNGKHWQP